MMGNKKRYLQDSDEEEEKDVDQSASDSDVQHKKTSKSKSATTSKGKTPSKLKTTKKPKLEAFGRESSPPHEEQTVRVFKNAEGENYVDLGKKKRAAVRSFKGQVFVDIREFYGSDGDEKPGKKGISLTKVQWQALKWSIDTIDSFFAEHGKE